jgi:hypothetical protein
MFLCNNNGINYLRNSIEFRRKTSFSQPPSQLKHSKPSQLKHSKPSQLKPQRFKHSQLKHSQLKHSNQKPLKSLNRMGCSQQHRVKIIKYTRPGVLRVNEIRTSRINLITNRLVRATVANTHVTLKFGPIRYPGQFKVVMIGKILSR